MRSTNVLYMSTNQEPWQRPNETRTMCSRTLSHVTWAMINRAVSGVAPPKGWQRRCLMAASNHAWARQMLISAAIWRRLLSSLKIRDRFDLCPGRNGAFEILYSSQATEPDRTSHLTRSYLIWQCRSICSTWGRSKRDSSTSRKGYLMLQSRTHLGRYPYGLIGVNCASTTWGWFQIRMECPSLMLLGLMTRQTGHPNLHFLMCTRHRLL